jgi:hypothetical protein
MRFPSESDGENREIHRARLLIGQAMTGAADNIFATDHFGIFDGGHLVFDHGRGIEGLTRSQFGNLFAETDAQLSTDHIHDLFLRVSVGHSTFASLP